MTIGLLFGRRIRVRVGSLLVCDVNPGASFAANEFRNLDVEFTCESHAKIEPLPTELVIYGLNEEVRTRMTAINDQARQIAYQKYQAVLVGDLLNTGIPDNANGLQVFDGPFDEWVASQNGALDLESEDFDLQALQQQLVSQGSTVIVEAGYGDDFGTIAVAQILPDGLSHKPMSPGWKTTIKAQDNRLAWSNAFVSEPVVGGVTFADLNLALRVSEQYLSGDIGAEEVEAQVPGLLERKKFPGYQNGAVLHGTTRDQNNKVFETLGLRPFWSNGQLVYLPVDGTLYEEAVVLREPPEFDIWNRPAEGGLLTYEKLTRGFLDVHCLLNYRLVTGRQVQVYDADGAPVGDGLFRVEHSRHYGSAFGPAYYTDAVLRPVTRTPQNNP